MIGTISLTLVFRIDILTLQGIAESCYLLLQGVFSHQQGEVETFGRLFFLQQSEDHAASEADDGGTFAVGVLHAVDVLCGFHAVLLHPLLDGLAESGSVYEARTAAQLGDSLLNLRLIVSRAPSELGHL